MIPTEAAVTAGLARWSTVVRLIWSRRAGADPGADGEDVRLGESGASGQIPL